MSTLKLACSYAQSSPRIWLWLLLLQFLSHLLVVFLFVVFLSFVVAVASAAVNGIGSVCVALVFVSRLLQAEDLQSQNGLCPQATGQHNSQLARLRR